MQKQRGFTLIEMLLVIAIIAVIISIGITQYRSHMIDTRVNKASLEVQGVLQAAMAYNVDYHGKWPQANAGIANCQPDDPASDMFIKNYIPNSQYRSVYGTNLCWSKVSSAVQDQQSRLFWVAIQVPDGNVNIAKRIAARLPNAVVTSQPQIQAAQACSNGDPCFVRAEIPMPGITSNNAGKLNLIAKGTCQTDKTISSNNAVCRDTSSGDSQTYAVAFSACPSGETPEIFPTVNYLYMPPGKNSLTPLTALRAEQISCSTAPDSNGKEACSFRVVAETCIYHKGSCKEKNIKVKSGATEGAGYLVICRSATKNANNKSVVRHWL